MRKIIASLLIIMIVFGLIGCSADNGSLSSSSNDSESTNNEAEIGVEKAPVSSGLVDNDFLYEDDKDTSVITMYLTVSEGNSSENTNHTWSEVNGHSVYYYEERGIDRYGCNALLQVGDENGPQKGELGYGLSIPNATVTIRGQTSSLDSQKSYKIKLKDDAGRWENQKVINLNKHIQDGTRFRNKLMYDLLEELPGLISLRTQFVHLYVKDTTDGGSGSFEDYGLYTHVEQPNKTFLKSHGFDSNGQLYKINSFEFYRYEDVIMPKSDADYDKVAFEKRIEIKGSDDHRKLIEMLEDVNDYSLSTDYLFEKWFDIDNVSSWMAFHILTGNIDTQSRNTLMYSALNDTKWYFISWDNDAALRRAEFALNGIMNYSWEQGISNYWGNMLFRRLLLDEQFKEALDNKIEEYKAILTKDKIDSMVNEYVNVVKPYTYGPYDYLRAPLSPEDYDMVCNTLSDEIDINYDAYYQSWKKPMPFYIGAPHFDENKLVVSWDPSFDFNGEEITYTFEIADNLEFKDCIIKMDTRLNELELDQVLEEGQYFLRVAATNASGESQYAFDYYVTNNSVKNYGVLCFYVLSDGTIQADELTEGE